MKERLLVFLKNNRKKVLTFLIAGLLAAIGIGADSSAIEKALNIILGLS